MKIQNLPIFTAEKGKVVHFSADSDTKKVTKTDILFPEDRKTELFNIVVADIGNHGANNVITG